MYEPSKLAYWAAHQAKWNPAAQNGIFASGDGRWVLSDGNILFCLERRPRGFSEIKTENLAPYFRDVGVNHILANELARQRPAHLDITTSDLESLKRKKEKQFVVAETAFCLKDALDVATVMGKGCRFGCSGKPYHWLWIWQAENNNSVAVIMPDKK